MRAFDYAVQIDRPPDLGLGLHDGPPLLARGGRTSCAASRPSRLVLSALGASCSSRSTCGARRSRSRRKCGRCDPPRKYGVAQYGPQRHGLLRVHARGDRDRHDGPVPMRHPPAWLDVARPALLLRDSRLRYRDQLSNLKREVEAGESSYRPSRHARCLRLHRACCARRSGDVTGRGAVRSHACNT